MRTTKLGARCLVAAAILAAAVSLLMLEATAWAQQGGVGPNFVTPRSQRPGPGATLEIPSNQPQTSIPKPVTPMGPQVGPELEIPSRQLRAQPGYTQTTVTVTNQAGVHVTDLTKNDFRVYENGQQRPIEFFRKDLNTPVSVGIIVDTSGSMAPKIPQARAAIAEFIRDLNPHDDVFLFAFSDKPFLLQPFTTNHRAVISRLPLLHAFGKTALYDVILDGLIMVQRGRYDKKALLVVTDGMDTASASSLQQVVAQARRQGVLVYSIGIGNPGGGGGGIGLLIGPFAFGGAGEDQVDARTLQLLSTETGAKTFIIREVGDGEALRQATASISHELREQYTIGFASPNPGRGGYRSLKVEVPSHPDLEVRVRKGVTVSRKPEAVASDPVP